METSLNGVTSLLHPPAVRHRGMSTMRCMKVRWPVCRLACGSADDSGKRATLCSYPPEVQGVHQGRHVNQVDLAADVVIPEHDETLAQLQTGLLGHQHRHGTTRLRPHQRAGGRRSAVLRAALPAVLENFQQQRGVHLGRILGRQFAVGHPPFRLCKYKQIR